MTDIFEVYSEKLSDPVTVFAHDASEACGLFVLWREAHAPDAKTDVVDIVQLTERDLAERPQLAFAALTSGSGIGAWLGHREGWVSCYPQDEIIGLLAPPKTDVGCYVFVSEEYGNVYVFEETRARAIGMFHVFSIDANGWEASEYDIVVLSPWLLQGIKITLREDMFEGKTGVARECHDGFWRIFPADYEEPLLGLPGERD